MTDELYTQQEYFAEHQDYQDNEEYPERPVFHRSRNRANARDWRRKAVIYLIFAGIVGLFSAIYEHFSFGVYSPFMITAFVYPLACAALCMVFSRLRRVPDPSWSGVLLAASCATCTVGSLFQGILEIYGTTNSLMRIYVIVGIVLAAGCAASLIARMRQTAR